jgi:hypothetical protein
MVLCYHLHPFCANLSKHSKAQVLHPMKTVLRPRARRIRLVACDGMRTSAISLLSNCELDTLTLWQRDPWLLRTDDEDVVLTGSEGIVYGILDMHNVEASIVTLSVGNDANTSHVTTTSDHGNDTSVELDEVGDLAGSKVDLDGVVDLDGWVRVTDSSRIVRDQEWDSAFAQLNSLDFAKLVFGLFGLDSVNGEAALGVVDQTEVLASLLDANDIHETGWVCGIGTNLAINLDQALHDNRLRLARVKGIL